MNKTILENWFEANKNHPYAASSVINQLCLMTSLDFQTVKRWIENKRTRSKDSSSIKGSKKQRINEYFTQNDREILSNFFKTISEHPGPRDIDLLNQFIQKDSKKIRNWFNSERFKKQSNDI